MRAADAMDRSLTAARVARRALVLLAVWQRAEHESGLATQDRGGVAARWRDVWRWVAGAGLLDDVDAAERDVLLAPLGALDPDLVAASSWRVEGAGMLAWALGRAPLPAHDRLVDAGALAPALGWMTPHTIQPDDRAPVWAVAELRRTCVRARTVHWRLREFLIRPRTIDFAGVVERARFGPLSLDGVPLVDGDLAVDGGALADADTERVRACLSAAVERHHAASWLLDPTVPYAEVPVHT